MTEIRKVREAEKKEQRRELFPIRLVDFDTLRDWICFDADTGKDLAVEVREYFIPDFSNWKDHDVFDAASAEATARRGRAVPTSFVRFACFVVESHRDFFAQK